MDHEARRDTLYARLFLHHERKKWSQERPKFNCKTKQRWGEQKRVKRWMLLAGVRLHCSLAIMPNPWD